MIVTVTPAPSLDRTYYADDFTEGRVNRARISEVEASGKGVNVSRALAAAGAPSVAVLPLGGPEGRQLAELLDADDVPYQAIPAGVPTRTNTTLAVTGRSTTKMNAPAPALAAQVWEQLLDTVAGLVGDGDWVLCSGTVPAGADDIPARLVALARAKGARSAVDSSGRALAMALDAGPNLVAPNHLELAEMVGADLSALHPDGGDTYSGEGDLALIEAAAGWAQQLSARTGGAVLATLGASGALYLGPGGRWHGIAPPIVPVNTVGAGDALLAGFLSAAGRPGWTGDAVAEPGGALATAVAWGTAACRMPGTAGDVAALAEPDLVRLSAVRSS
ncbi:hexose kinase [Nakamurella sp. YIM 132087]|uniref:Hexose kinase n=1 Tax=Nakamurella alba TaxID=2665158 RepID=A0A7K1FTT0_9ACTN|nr:1-phosphofructokinase family hexose kinase [Nakamurella alba]MTD16214.1 hexose kinase [Nakamurella alba]